MTLCENPKAEEGALVARAAMPHIVTAASNIHCSKSMMDSLVTSLDELKIIKKPADEQQQYTSSPTTTKSCRATAPRRSDAVISPADFVNLQSMRSSALARKTNTTSKFSRDCRNLFADLLATTGANETKLNVNEDDADKTNSPSAKKQENKTEKKSLTEAKTSEKKNSEKKEELTKGSDKTVQDLNKSEAKKEVIEDKNQKETQQQKESKNKKEEQEDEDEKLLLSRGPVRMSSTNTSGQSAEVMYGTAAQSTVYDPTSFSSNIYSYGYDCGLSSGCTAYGSEMSNSYGNSSIAQGNVPILDSRESTPDTIHSDVGYGSAYSPQFVGAPARATNYDSGAKQLPYTMNNNAVGGSGLASQRDDWESSRKSMSVSKSKVKEQELPDALSDFILQYSRCYASDEGSQGTSPAQFSSTLTSTESSLTAYHDLDFHSAPNSNKTPTDSGESACASPLSAVSAPKCSPAQPHGAWSASAVGSGDAGTASRLVSDSTTQQPTTTVGRSRHAKERLRALINNDDMDEAWAWTCKCIQNYPGALCYQDSDRDTLLHIVTVHADYAKIYALVEQMLKLECEYNGGVADPTRRQKPFDMPNRVGETPLYLAVEKRDAAVVDYLLEAGAYPNAQNAHATRDAPLHYAVARGFDNIVEILCSYSHIDVNIVNEAGLTPLLYAVCQHGTTCAESGVCVDNAPVVRALLRHGANVNITNSTNGKTVFHYAAERKADELITIIHSHLGDELSAALMARTDHAGNLPLCTLCDDTTAAAKRTRAALAAAAGGN